MTQPEGWFKGDIATIGAVDIEGPLATAKAPCCQYYMSSYGNAAREAQEKGDETAAELYSFLGSVTSFLLRFDTPREPYGPRFQDGDRRGLTPADLPASDIDAIREIAQHAKDPALLARLFDVIWEGTKDHLACEEAAGAYLEAAQHLQDEENWVHAVECFHRGIYLACLLGKSEDLYKRAEICLLEATKEAAGEPRGLFCFRLMDLLMYFRIGDPKEFGPIALKIAEVLQIQKDLYRARPYWEIAAKWQGLAKNIEGKKAALLSAAETYVAEAESRLEGNSPSRIAAAHLLVQGIEALRRAGGDPTRIRELRKRLAGYQKESLSEMHELSGEVDIPEAVEPAVRRYVSCADFWDALTRLAFGQGLESLAELRERVLAQAGKYPFKHFGTNTILDEHGRTIEKQEGLSWPQGAAYEEALEREMFQDAVHGWGVIAQCFIEPARSQLFNDHHPALNDLRFMVTNHPFVPTGHEEFYLRGIHAGFHGEFIEASHLLVPQIENSIRHVLETRGVDVSNLKPDGTQQSNMLKCLLKKEETLQIFGEELCFGLRGCLIEKSGFAFRDKLAHGLLKVEECCMVAPLYIWWLVLRLLLTPLMRATSKEDSTNPESGC